MVTPVHRFQSVECVAANNARHHPRPLGLHPRQPNACHHISPSYNGSIATHHNAVRANNHAHSMELDSGVFLDLPVDTGQRPSATSDHVNGSHHILPAGKLKCGMWASFAIVTVFMAGAKFYFNNQSTGMEVLIFCSLLVVVLFAGCTVSLCEAVTSAPAPTAVIEAAAVQPLQQDIESSTQASNEDLAVLGIQIPTQPIIHNQPEPPPPPYHIAVLLPQQTEQQQIIDDSPPPSYDKAVS